MAKQKKKKVSEAIAIVSLILNVLVLPGLGTLIGGKTKEGIWQIVLVVGGIFTGIILVMTGTIIGLLLIILGPLAGWIWGLVSGIQLINKAGK